jgi:predicted transglutaminase-like cysteine proteinase
MPVIQIAMFMLIASVAISLDETRMLQTARALGTPAVEGLIAWQKMHNAAGSKPEITKISVVNNFFNQRTRFVDDVVAWGQPDYWATPLETLFKGAGDCEDYAIAKYFTLLALGIPPARLRLIYVRAAMTRDGAVTFIPQKNVTSGDTTPSPACTLRGFSFKKESVRVKFHLATGLKPIHAQHTAITNTQAINCNTVLIR